MLAVEDASMKPVAERIALNARDAGLSITVTNQPAAADVRLTALRISSQEPAKALAALAVALGLPEPARADSPEGLYGAERALLEAFRVIPLIHLPDVYGAAARVKGGNGITPLGEWRFENLAGRRAAMMLSVGQAGSLRRVVNPHRRLATRAQIDKLTHTVAWQAECLSPLKGARP
jgi:hypothetical protein